MRKREGLLEREAPRPSNREDLLENHTFWLFGFLLFSTIFAVTLMLTVPYAELTGQLVKPALPESQLSKILEGASNFNTMSSPAGIQLAQKLLDTSALPDKNTIFICRFEDNLDCVGNAKPEVLVNLEGKKTNTLATAQFSSGRFGRGFDVSKVYLKIPNVNPLTSLEGTIDFWVKTSWNANDGLKHAFVDNRPAGYSIDEYKNALKISKFVLNQNGEISNYFSFKIIDKDGKYLEANTYLNKTLTSEWTKDKWHHIAAVWNLVEGKIQLFIDGNKVAEKTMPISLYNPDPVLYVGADKDGDQPSSSTIDELRFSSKAKTEEELKSYYDQGIVTLKEFDAGKNVVLKGFSWMDEAPLDFGVAYWSFDDNEGATANEQNNNKGTLIGADTPTGTTLPKWTRDSIHGTALQFAGEKSYVEIPINTSFNLTDFSIEAWVKTSERREQSILSTFSLSDTNNPLAFNPFYQLEVLDTGEALLFVSNKTAYEKIKSTTDVADGKWHQIIGVRDTKQKKIVVYIDGKLENTVDDATSGNIYPSANVWIGNQKDRSGRNFKGTIDEVRVLNRTLSPTEVLLSYERKFWKTYAQTRFKKDGSDWEAFGGNVPIPHFKNRVDYKSKGQLALLTFESSDTFWQSASLESQQSLVDGMFGQGAKFESQQLIKYPSSYLNLSEGTIDFWIKLNQDSLQQTQTILESGTDKNSLKIYLSGSDKKIKLSITDKLSASYDLSADISSWKANEWHHAAFAWKADDGSDRNRILLFLEGKLVAENPSKTNKILFDGQSATFTIGNSNAKNTPALATLDDFQITNVFRATELYESGYSNPLNEKLNTEARYAQARILLTTFDSAFTPAISAINFFSNETLPTTQLSATPTPTVSPSATPVTLQTITVSKPNITYPLQSMQVSGKAITIKWTPIANVSKYGLVVRDRTDTSLRCTDCGNNCANNPYFVCVGNISNSTTSFEIPVLEEHYYSAWVEAVSPTGLTNTSDYAFFTVNKSATPAKTPTPTQTPSPTPTVTPTHYVQPTLTPTPKPPQQESPAPVSPVTSVKKGPSTIVIVVLILLLIGAIVGGFFAFKFIAGKKEEEITEVRKEKLTELKGPPEISEDEKPKKSEVIKPLEDFEPVEGGIKLKQVKPEVPQELKEYVESFLNKGFSKEQIRKTLKQVGWNEDVIDAVLSE